MCIIKLVLYILLWLSVGYLLAVIFDWLREKFW